MPTADPDRACGSVAAPAGALPMRARLVHLRDLLRELVLRDLRIRYKRSMLGIAWSLLNPLSQILIFSFLFGRLMPLAIPHYTTFVFVGVLAWSWFSAALISAAGTVVASPELIRRPGFPAAVLPVLTVASNGIHFLIALPVLLAFAIFSGGTVGVTLVAFPLVVTIQFLLTLALVFPVAAWNVRFRDTQHLVSLLTMAAFYLTPVFYSAQNIPAGFQLFYALNPMATLLTAYRDILIRNEWPDVQALLVVALVSLVVLALGVAIFERASVRFAEDL